MAYNGWTNYETWNVALWYGNDQGSYNQVTSMAQEAWDDAEASGTFTRAGQAALDLAKALEDMVGNENPLAGEASMWSDLLGAALSEVNWREWAENLLEDVDKEEEETEVDNG